MDNKKVIINMFTKRQISLALRSFGNVVLGVVVMFVLVACSDLGERDNPLDPAAWGYEPSLKSPFECNLENWNAKRDAYNTKWIRNGFGLHSASVVTDPRDKNIYRTVVINDMRVFAENLRYADSAASVNLKSQTWCYNNEEKNCKIGGRYYTWTAAMNLDSEWRFMDASNLIRKQHQGICPDGWHIPNNAEWNTLFRGVGYASQQMKDFNGWEMATDSSGFSALPVGYYRNGVFNEVGSHACFWSATEERESGRADFWMLKRDFAGLANFSKSDGLAIRCVQNN